MRQSAGFTLLEVMIALVIFSIGLLGLAGLQAGGLRSNYTAELRTIAMIQAQDMAERILANPQGVDANAYDNLAAAIPGQVDCVNANCGPINMANFDHYEWNTANDNLLPAGVGRVQGGGAGTAFTITVMWDEDRSGATGTGCSGDPAVDLKCYSLTIRP